MSLQTRLAALITAIGADIKPLKEATYIQPGYKVGWYYSQHGTSNGNTAMNINELKICPMFFSVPFTFDRVSIQVGTASGAGGIMRVGWWNTDNTGMPSTLGLDFGSIDTTATGERFVTISGTIPAGLIWLGGVTQVSTCSTHAVGSPSVNSLLIGQSGVGSGDTSGYAWSGVSGALGTFTSSSHYGASQTPRIYLRKAA